VLPIVQAGNHAGALASRCRSRLVGKAEALIADSGYFSAANVEACHAYDVEPYIAAGRDAHYPPLAQRMSDPPAVADDATAVDRMKHRLRTAEGRQVYVKRDRPLEEPEVEVRRRPAGAGIAAVERKDARHPALE
jgi:hypothetical protein